jgi:hypothetical protein
MSGVVKNANPFSPAKPVIPELFVGRQAQIQRIMQRGVGQTLQGKPTAFFIEGEYGIGKSSIAQLIAWLAEQEGVLSIYGALGGAKDMDQVAETLLQNTIRAGVFNPSRWGALKEGLAKYVKDPQLNLFALNLTFDMAALKQDAPTIASSFGILSFLSNVAQRLAPQGIKGVLLVLDEINGIAANPIFARTLKSLWDTNAMVTGAAKPLPLVLILCGTSERWAEMMRQHEPVERVFDLIPIESLSKPEMEDFFRKSFDTAGMTVDQDALDVLSRYSAGFPRIMHLVGDAAYWLDDDGRVSRDDAFGAILTAAEELGRKFVDAQVYRALQSRDYHSILQKIGKLSPDSTTFTREEVVVGLTESERRKFDNFVNRMKSLSVIRQGVARGEYEFTVRMVRLYIWLKSTTEKK